jgi:prepilin-type N-terminal cleavage/methylation domain-containing protein
MRTLVRARSHSNRKPGGRDWLRPVAQIPELDLYVAPVPRTHGPSRRGYSLLELTVAMSLLAVVMTATSSVLRSSRQVWEAHESDLTRLQTAHAVVRHIVRQAREASEVVSVDANQPSGAALTVRLPDGDELSWQHDSRSNQVLFRQASVSATSQVVAEHIDSLEFRPTLIDGSAYQPDRTDRIQELTVLAGVTLQRETATVRRSVASVWLRAFGRNRSQ